MYVKKKLKNELTIIYLSVTLIHFPADSVLSDEFFSGRNQEKEARARARGPPRRHPSLTTVSWRAFQMSTKGERHRILATPGGLCPRNGRRLALTLVFYFNELKGTVSRDFLNMFFGLEN
jgi:hypothetical protein